MSAEREDKAMKRIFINANGYSMDKDNSRFQAVVTENGLIRYVGENSGALAEKEEGDEVIDLSGKMMLPGFNDSHLHLLSYGYSLEVVDLNDCRSLEELKERLRTYIRENHIEKGQWVEGRGWDQNQFDTGKMPTRFDLDEEFGDYYVVLTRTCAQISVVTTNVLELAGILNHPKQIEGGMILTDENDIATGLLTGLATEIVYRIIPKLGVERIKKCILAACNQYITSGMTSTQTDDFELLRAGNFKEILQAYEELDRDGLLPMRVNLMLHLATVEELKEFIALGYKTGDGSPFFRIGPFKTITDGSLGGRTAALREPYSDNPSEQKDNCGEMYISKEELETLTQMAYDNGLQLVSDGIGDRAMRTVLDAFIKIIEKNPEKDLRFGIDHCQITTEGIIEDFAKYKIVGGLELVFLASDIAIAGDRVGEHRASMSYNWKQFSDSGVVIAAGSDSPVEEFSPLDGIYAAVTRCTYDKEPEGGYYPQQKLSMEEALHAFTTGPAYATFEEDKKGSIETGKYADFVVLEKDLYETDPLDIMDVSVEMTVVNGEIVYTRG